MCTLTLLPEELKIIIVSYLDTEPPSSSWHELDLSPALLEPKQRPLKQLSLVSKQWNRLIRPHLFSCIHIRLRYDEEASAKDPALSTFRNTVRSCTTGFKAYLFAGDGYPNDIVWPYRHSWQDTRKPAAEKWFQMLDDYTSQFLLFIRKYGLAGSVKFLTVSALEEIDNSSLDALSDEMHCCIASAAFWNVLFASINPTQLTILGSPSSLPCLLSCRVFLGDAWAFSGMSTQLVTLRNPLFTTPNPCPVYNQSVAMTFASDDVPFCEPAPASILYLRLWTQLCVNEGSYLQAYTTYEYFHKRPPGILRPLTYTIAHTWNQNPASPPRRFSSITSLKYTAIFPFSRHVDDAFEPTSGLQHLSLRMTPSPSNHVFEDPDQVRRADVSDCWSELDEVYRWATWRGGLYGEARDWELQSFESGDCGIASVREPLERMFEDLKWEMLGQGKWRITPEAREARRIENEG